MPYITQFESLLRRLDRQFGVKTGDVPGAILSRALIPKGGVGWSLGLGKMQEPKCYFYAKTIRGCIGKARRAILKGKARAMTLGEVLAASEEVLLRAQTVKGGSNGLKTRNRAARKAQ